MRWIMLLIVALLPTTGQAGVYQDKDGSWWTQVDPPAHYRTAPYIKPPSVKFLMREVAFRICLFRTRLPNQLGCAWFEADACEIRLADDMPDKYRKAVLIHEDAHCRGWPADHPVDDPSATTVSAPYSTGWPRVTPPE